MTDAKIIVSKGKVKLLSGPEYAQENKLLCKIKDTGNGFIAKFPSWIASHQDNYICMDYSEAEYLVAGLTELMKQWNNNDASSNT